MVAHVYGWLWSCALEDHKPWKPHSQVAMCRPTPALRWALATVRACMQADWPSELLGHELGGGWLCCAWAHACWHAEMCAEELGMCIKLAISHVALLDMNCSHLSHGPHTAEELGIGSLRSGPSHSRPLAQQQQALLQARAAALTGSATPAAPAKGPSGSGAGGPGAIGMAAGNGTAAAEARAKAASGDGAARTAEGGPDVNGTGAGSTAAGAAAGGAAGERTSSGSPGAAGGAEGGLAPQPRQGSGSSTASSPALLLARGLRLKVGS